METKTEAWFEVNLAINQPTNHPSDKLIRR